MDRYGFGGHWIGRFSDVAYGFAEASAVYRPFAAKRDRFGFEAMAGLGFEW
jgi:hypothetical protein